MKYRAEVDGLRAVAILPVIFFHAGFKAFEGGFVGVDVFFVVSGYLITSIILTDMNNDKFSIVTFYERRARRIMPALFFVMFCCLPFAYLWLLPNHLKDFSQSLTAVAAFSSNILFWRESGYFGVASELKPLLHTWSLAVEEQYYVLFPLFLMLLWKLRKRWIFGALMVVGAISLAAAQWGAYNKPSATFFLLPTRGWELAIGALIAFYFLYKREHAELIKRYKKTSEVLGAVGLVMICSSVFAFDNNTPFPSFYALIPTFGAGLVIVFTTSETVVGRLLSTKFMVSVGLISYSTYLWHQPLFVFARHKSLGEPSTALLLLLSAASMMLAYISWRYVESPFRNKKLVSKKAIFTFTIVGSVLFAAIGVAGHVNDGFVNRYDIPKSVYSSLVRTERQNECFGKKNIHTVDDWYCDIGNSSHETNFMVFGDSHALSFLPAVDAVAKDIDLHGIFVGTSGCTPLLGVHALRPDQPTNNCYQLNRRVYDFVKKNKINNLYLVARWTYYTDGGYSGSNFSYISNDEYGNKSKNVSRVAFENGLKNTLNEYGKIGTNVLFVTQVPQQLYDPLELYMKSKNIDKPISEVSVSVQDHIRLQSYVKSLFVKYKVKVVDLDEAFCRLDNCTVGNKEVLYYYDSDHLSLSGSEKIENIIKNSLKQAGKD